MMGGMGMGMGSGFGLGGAAFGGIFSLLILGLIIWVAITVVNNNRRREGYTDLTPKTDALEILKQRYARGEISSEEFEKMKRDLLS